MKENVGDVIEAMPHHIAIIMDGNGRWAQSKGHERAYGHLHGIESVRTVLKACANRGVRYLTLYTFSEENWARPIDEVEALMDLLISSLEKEVDELDAMGVRIKTIGRIDRLPNGAQQTLAKAIDRTSKNERITLVLALSYSGRQEMIQATQQIAQQVANGTITPQEIDNDIITKALYTHDIPDPDLLIRTGGECRISNFLLWQIAYTELYFCDTYWPDFSEEDLDKAIDDYRLRQRRYGRTGDQITSAETI